ncbi:MAG TPA: ATP-binding protein, partial [Gemmataceae bacterium]|nr:ATP-binding protein [Gemmataceae bacterium]
MFPWNPDDWTETYLLSLIGQPESVTLEFKAGRALAKKEDKDRFIKDQLSREVSAFANSEGGILVVGMEDDRNTKPRVAKQLDGVPVGKGHAIESPDQWQQIVDSCVSPFLPGLRIKQIRLSGNLEGLFALVVYVPPGNTAYQARDHLYYSRSEFEAKSLPDHEVRLRMMRGRVAQAQLHFGDIRCTTADQDFEQRRKQRETLAAAMAASEDPVLYGRGGIPPREVLDAPRRTFDEYEFGLAVVNGGELT